MLIFVGILFTILFFAFTAGICGDLYIFIDSASLIIILLPLLFFLLVSKSGKIMHGYIKSSFKKDYDYSKAELESIAAAAKNTVKIILASGGFGFVVGIIALLVRLDMNIPGLLALNLSVSLITMMYAIAISFFVFFPLQAWAENKLKTEEH